MLLTIEEIKKGFLHPEFLVREPALRYFTDAWSTNPTIMPLAVEAIRTLDWRDALHPHLHLKRLRQTPETLAWFIDELEKTRPSQQYPDFHSWLCTIVAAADVDLLRPHLDRLLHIAGEEHHENIQERLRLAAQTSADCWGEMEAFCEAEKNTEFRDAAASGQAGRLVEAIGRDTASADRVMSLLALDVDHVEGNPMEWMELIAVGTAGEMRLKAAIPLLTAKLRADISDWIDMESSTSLTKIGGEEVAAAIEQEFESIWNFRLYAAPVLSDIRCPAATPIALRLYERELRRTGDENELILASLLLAGVANFSSEAVEPARQFLLRDRDQIVQEGLVAAATLMGTPFPELEKWRKQAQLQRNQRNQQMQEMHRWRLSPLRQELAPAISARKPMPPREPAAPPQPIEIPKPIHAEEKAGRNAPCPCGSGKKYKKCCMEKK